MTASRTAARSSSAIRGEDANSPPLLGRLCASIGRAPIAVMHVCGSHEQAIARFGLRASLPRALDVIMGPGCPVCVTDQPEVDEAVALALAESENCDLRRHAARARKRQVTGRRQGGRRTRRCHLQRVAGGGIGAPHR